jgi:hypothetical protein
MTREHEARYQVALAKLNEASITVLADRLANRVAGIACNRFVGAAAAVAREQRERMEGAVGLFERAIDEATTRTEASLEVAERRFTRTLFRLSAAVASLFMMLVGAVIVAGGHLR